MFVSGVRVQAGHRLDSQHEVPLPLLGISRQGQPQGLGVRCSSLLSRAERLRCLLLSQDSELPSCTNPCQWALQWLHLNMKIELRAGHAGNLKGGRGWPGAGVLLLLSNLPVKELDRGQTHDFELLQGRGRP